MPNLKNIQQTAQNIAQAFLNQRKQPGAAQPTATPTQPMLGQMQQQARPMAKRTIGQKPVIQPAKTPGAPGTVSGLANLPQKPAKKKVSNNLISGLAKLVEYIGQEE